MLGFPSRLTPGRRSVTLALLLVTAAGLWSAIASSAAADAERPTLNGFDLSGALIPVDAIQRGGPPKDGIPAIDVPKFVAADKAGLAATERVLGLSIYGQPARAYPIRILNWHEVVNDRFGDRRVVVSYCPLCGTGMVFEPPAKSDTTFGVSGLLYNSDVLLYDRASDSLWSQIMQTAVTGPAKGSRLKMLPVTHTSWADWHARNPETLVLSTETGSRRDYQRDPYAAYEQMPTLMFDVSNRDDRLPLKEWVLGVEVDGRFKAYPFSSLAGAVDAKGQMRDRIGRQSLQIRYDAKHRNAEAFDEKGQKLPTITAYWFAWVAFHPKTDVLLPR